MRRRAVVAAAFLVAAWPAGAQVSGFEGADFQRRREEYLEGPRAFPSGVSPDEAVFRARLAMKAQGGLSRLSIGGAASASWQPVGPGGFFMGDNGFFGSSPQTDAGRVDYISLHPTIRGTMLLASPQGGVWRTQSDGDSWAPLTDNECTLRMAATRFDPVNPSIVYAATAASSGVALCGMLRSIDGGNSWTTINGGFSSFTGGNRDIYIDPVTAGNATTTVLVANGGGVLRTTNSGTQWNIALSGSAHSIVALPNQPGTLFTGIFSNTPSLSGLYRSTDNGATWTQLSSGTIDLATGARFQLAVSSADPNKVWMLVGGKDSKLLALTRWDEATQQMTRLAASGVDVGSRGTFGKQATYDLVVAVDPLDAGIVYAGGVRMYRSTDGGASFRQMAGEVHCDWHYLVIDPSDPKRLYAGTDGGIFISRDGGNNWVSRNNGLAISMIYPGISQHPADRWQITAGLQDNGTIVSNGTPIWRGLTGGDGGYTAINPVTPSVIWTEAQWTPNVGPAIYRSGASRIAGIVGTDRGLFIPPLVMDPMTPSKLYFATHRLYRTTDDGTSWLPISADLTRGTGTIFSLAVAPSDTMTIYVTTNDGNVQVSRDHGATFTLSVTGLPLRAFPRVVVDATNASRALVVASGTGSGHVFLTADAGTTWTNVSGNLPDVPATAAAMVDDGPNHFFVGNDLGVFETTDAGVTWSRSPGGLPNVQVRDLSYNAATRQLVAATHGRGMFTYLLSTPVAVLRGDVNRDGKVDAFDALLIQTALLGGALSGGLTPLPHGDTNCNGTLEAADLLITLRAAVGLTSAGACVGLTK
jgi:photosystem II stability/assembly factor-like uncharacterized protein